MEEIQEKMHLRLIEKKLQSYSGFTFEEHARFLLKVIDSRFTFTRLRKDGKIDGYKRMVTKKRWGKNRSIEIYSIFGKEVWTAPDNNKIFVDLKDAIEYAKNNDFLLKKWCPVVNFELDTEFRHKLEDVCEENDILFEEINPSVLITKFTRKDKIFTATCYFNAFEAPKLPLSTYSNHELARRALTMIFDNNSKSTNEKFEILKEIVSTILNFSFIDNKPNYTDNMYKTIGTKTMIYKDFIYSYKFFNGSFLPEKNDILGRYFTKDEDGCIILQVPNLVPIFLLCNKLEKQLEKSGDIKFLKH
ncbi:hypothetical protein [Rossellomorea yichunensis]|uniref:hypothetical protein n=1 Tax=Rossellomorea yichunensis TaxID=3077331 RepID=UPI0028DFBB3F|nr:hypothetical protein [Rossellomorea sp. YC4-1]MDT9025660.1 hypothetical protein [Rossellomorea sp. YC4-1]